MLNTLHNFTNTFGAALTSAATKPLFEERGQNFFQVGPKNYAFSTMRVVFPLTFQFLPKCRKRCENPEEFYSDLQKKKGLAPITVTFPRVLCRIFKQKKERKKGHWARLRKLCSCNWRELKTTDFRKPQLTGITNSATEKISHFCTILRLQGTLNTSMLGSLGEGKNFVWGGCRSLSLLYLYLKFHVLQRLTGSDRGIRLFIGVYSSTFSSISGVF